MTRKKMSATPRRASRPTVMLEIELPVLSDEATYYAQILNHHADRACMLNFNGAADKKRDDEPDLF